MSYTGILVRWLWLILLLTAATVAVVYYRASTAPPVYQASVTLQVIAQEPEEVALFTPIRGTGTQEQIRAVRDEFVSILDSETIARRTVAALNLGVSAQQLLDDIALRWEDEFITVLAQAVGPQAAEALATTHVDTALAYYRQVRSLPVEITEQFIAEQLVAAQEELAAAEDTFLKFKLQYNVGSLHREIGAVQDVIRLLGQQRDERRVEMERYSVLAAEMQRESAEFMRRAEDAEEDAAEARSAAQALIDAAASEAADADEAPTEPPEGLDDAQTEAEKAAETAEYYRSVARTFETSAVNHGATAEAARTAAAQFGQIIADREAELATLIGLSAEYDTLESNLSQQRERVSFLASKANEAETKKSQVLATGYLQIIEPAHTPGNPMPSNTWQLMALGAAVSLILGTILAFLLEILTARRSRSRRRPS
jgi:uncharacterized protein involved in exopolysaccharide biosynthesis